MVLPSVLMDGMLAVAVAVAVVPSIRGRFSQTVDLGTGVGLVGVVRGE